MLKGLHIQILLVYFWKLPRKLRQRHRFYQKSIISSHRTLTYCLGRQKLAFKAFKLNLYNQMAYRRKIQRKTAWLLFVQQCSQTLIKICCVSKGCLVFKGPRISKEVAAPETVTRGMLKRRLFQQKLRHTVIWQNYK